MLDQLDSFAGNCGLSLPTLFERIGSMAAHGQHRPRDFTPRGYIAYSDGSACGDPSLPGNPQRGTGGAGKTACEDNSQLHRVPDRVSSSAAGIRMESQGVHRSITEPAHAANRRVQ